MTIFKRPLSVLPKNYLSFCLNLFCQLCPLHGRPGFPVLLVSPEFLWCGGGGGCGGGGCGGEGVCNSCNKQTNIATIKQTMQLNLLVNFVMYLGIKALRKCRHYTGFTSYMLQHI